MKKWLVLLVLALALGVVIGGCGGDDDDGGGGGGGSSSAPAQQDTGGGGGGQAAGGTEEVKIVDNAFEPKDVTVKAGTTVKWTNDGQVPHTVTKEGDFDSGTLDPGSDFEQKFDKAGEYQYICQIHAGQSGTVKVE